MSQEPMGQTVEVTGQRLQELLDKVASVPSTSDRRVENNVMRHQYKLLSEEDKQAMQAVKDLGLALHDRIEALGQSREVSLAKTKVEEAVMWAVKHITK